MDTMKDTKMQPAKSAVIEELRNRLEAAESECLEQARLNGMGAEREAALMAKLEAAEKERDDFAQQLVQSEVGKREISEAHDALQVEVGKLKDLEVSRCVKINGYIVDNARLAEEVERLRAKVAEMEKQEPFDADSDVFRGAFEAALKAGNWPATRQGDGYRSPSTQIAWRIAFSTVNRLKLYLAPDAKGEEK